MPDISATGHIAVFLIVVGNGNAVHDALGCGDLIRAHDHEHILRRENAVLGQDVQQRMTGKERLGKVDQIRNDAVIGICPIRREFKAIAGFALFLLAGIGILDSVEAGAIGVVLGVRTVGDDKNLRILEQTAASPEGIPLIAVDLVERLADGHAASFELYMHQRESIHQNGYIIAVIMLCALILTDLILIDDLQEIVVDVLFVDQRDVLGRAIIANQHLHVILLDFSGLICDAVVGIGDAVAEKALPFILGEGIAVQLFQLRTQVGDKLAFRMDGQVFIALLAKQANKLLLQHGFALIAVRTCLNRLVFGDNGILRRLGDDIEIRHCGHSFS